MQALTLLSLKENLDHLEDLRTARQCDAALKGMKVRKQLIPIALAKTCVAPAAAHVPETVAVRANAVGVALTLTRTNTNKGK